MAIPIIQQKTIKIAAASQTYSNITVTDDKEKIISNLTDYKLEKIN